MHGQVTRDGLVRVMNPRDHGKVYCSWIGRKMCPTFAWLDKARFFPTYRLV